MLPPRKGTNDPPARDQPFAGLARQAMIADAGRERQGADALWRLVCDMIQTCEFPGTKQSGPGPARTAAPRGMRATGGSASAFSGVLFMTWEPIIFLLSCPFLFLPGSGTLKAAAGIEEPVGVGQPERAGAQRVAKSPLDGERQKLRRRIEDLLRDELKSHWYPHAVNRVRGGFHQSMGRDWLPGQDSNVFLVYQARMTWTAAAFAEYSPEDRDQFVGYARHGIAFLDRVLRDQEFGGFHWVLDREGHVDPKEGDEKHVYGTSFVIYAASKAFQVTGDPLARKVARDAFDWLERHAHDSKNGGYFEATHGTGRRSSPGTPWHPWRSGSTGWACITVSSR